MGEIFVDWVYEDNGLFVDCSKSGVVIYDLNEVLEWILRMVDE